jgi:hypothetical protein
MSRPRAGASPEEVKKYNEFWENLQNKRREKYYKKQAAPSAQQALPQSDLMAQRKAAYDQLNSFMQNEYMPTITKDTQLQQMRARQQELSSTIEQNRTSFLNSLGFTEDKLRDPNLNPAIKNFLSAGLTAWVQSQPEYQQIQQTNNNVERYIQQTYPELAIKQKTLSNLANPQINPTQQQAFENAQSAAIKKANEKFKERVSRPVQPPQQDPIVDPKRPTTTGPKPIIPIKQPTVNPIVDPIRPTLSAPPPPPIVTPDPALEPPKPITPIERPPVGPIVDPIRPTLSAPPPPPKVISDPDLEAPKPITPIVPPEPKGPIVDPKREPYRPIKPIVPVKRQPVGPIVDPKREPYRPPNTKPTTPANTGLIKQKPVNPYVPMEYKGLNTNITKGLMNR